LTKRGGASIWSEFYAKEITKVVNLAQPGDTITIDASKAVDIALGNEIQSLSEVFTFDNANSEVCVKLSRKRKTCYAYFNNVDVIESPTDILTIEIVEKQRQGETSA